MNMLKISLTAALCLATLPALAGHERRHGHHYGHDPYQRYEAYEAYEAQQGYPVYRPQYVSPAPQRVEYAEVLSSTPVYRDVRIEQPRRECWDQQVNYEERRQAPWFNNGVGGSVVGAIAGGVAGHQFGKGRGKDAATVLGAVIGAGIGQRVALENSRPRETVQHVGYEQVCQTVVEHRIEQRVDGYDIAYRYGGQTYHTRMPYDPGARLPVDVNIRPVSY